MTLYYGVKRRYHWVKVHRISVYHFLQLLASLFSQIVCAQSLSPVMSNSLRPHELQPASLLSPWESSRQEYRSGLPCSPPGDLSNPETEPRSPTLQILYRLSYQGSPSQIKKFN